LGTPTRARNGLCLPPQYNGLPFWELCRYNAEASLRFYKDFRWPDVLQQLSSGINASRELKSVMISVPAERGKTSTTISLGDLFAALHSRMLLLYNASMSEINATCPPQPNIHYLWSTNVDDAVNQMNVSLSSPRATALAANTTLCIPTSLTEEAPGYCTDMASAIALAANATRDDGAVRKAARAATLPKLGSWAFNMGVRLGDWLLSNVPGTPSFFNRFAINSPTLVISSVPTYWPYQFSMPFHTDGGGGSGDVAAAADDD